MGLLPATSNRPVVALLTGATGGLGVEMARALAGRGVHLALSARPGPRLEELVGEIEKTGVRCAAVPGDLADHESTATLVERAEEAVGPVDLLVNNASMQVTSAFEGYTTEELERIVQVNLLAPMELTRRVLPGMLERGRGQVVFVSSMAGHAGAAFETPYATTKGGLIALCRSLRAEFADRPVTFSMILPGPVAGQGMFARAVAEGMPVPRAIPLVKPRHVAQALIRAVTREAPEVLVPGAPSRMVVAITGLAPRLAERLAGRMGTARMFAPLAKIRGRA